jgi:transposase
MMGRREDGQGQFFYSFDLDEVVPSDHLVRQIDAVLDLGWVHKELAPYYSHTGRPSIDPVLIDPNAHRRLRVRNPLRATDLR